MQKRTDSVVDRIDAMLSEYTYKPKKVDHGRKRSKASRLTGTDKLKYKQRLRKLIKKHRNDSSFKAKERKYNKKHKKTQSYKQSVKKYKQYHK